jgi:hypothetical protein
MTVSKGQERDDKAAAAKVRLQTAVGVGHITTAGGRIVIRISPDEADELAEAVILGRTAKDIESDTATHEDADRAMDYVAYYLDGQPAGVADPAALILAAVLGQHLRSIFTNPTAAVKQIRRDLHRGIAQEGAA